MRSFSSFIGFLFIYIHIDLKIIGCIYTLVFLVICDVTGYVGMGVGKSGMNIGIPFVFLLLVRT